MNHETQPTLKQRLFTIIFYADTPAGKAFDVALIVCILGSVLVVMFDSVKAINQAYDPWLSGFEWFFTILFSLEYLTRIYCSPEPRKYIFSFYGIVDLLSIIPTYLSLFVLNVDYLMVIRLFRVMRLFRILRLSKFVSQANLLVYAVRQSRHKITVFMFSVVVLVTIFGSIMYMIEGPHNGYTSIPRSIYWAIVTMTTVGYGDISPKTDLGQAVAALVMMMGYGILAVPTGIFTAELANAMRNNQVERPCSHCGKKQHEESARYCNACGHSLSD
ncbi:MAG: ion transporter [Hahellaceae bacterium]|nr:ion transporter [Hahellaceae bacterium]